MKLNNLKPLFLAAISLLLLNSCALIELQRDLNFISRKGAIGGKVKHPYNNKASNIVIVFDKERQIVAYKRLHPEDTYYLFMLPPNKAYHIFAYNDLNQDMYYNKTEPVGKWLNTKNVTVKPGDLYELPDILINSKNTIPNEYVALIDKASKKKTNNMIVRSGVVADINNKIFNAAHGEKGLWSPVELFEEAGSGVYFLEKYDPDKIPILFIHGIAGYPQSWKTFFKKIDRDKFQIWFYHYPSGYYIKDNSETLDMVMGELYAKYKFKQVYIVSHSMGGLIASGFIINTVIKRKAPYVKLFIALSSPWEGSKKALLGVKYSPSVAPSWEDLQPESKYLKFLHAYNIGKSVPLYNFFSYKGTSIPYNDGAISLESQLNLKMQDESIKSLGFYCTHKQMLQNQSVISHCNEILKQERLKNE